LFDLLRSLQSHSVSAESSTASRAGLIVYAARNQYAHWDDEQPHEVTKNVFAALSAAFSHDMLSDLAFALSNPTINVYANEVLLVALGWKSYDTYLAEMTSLLR
jgi:hypothetical protein